MEHDVDQEQQLQEAICKVKKLLDEGTALLEREYDLSFVREMYREAMVVSQTALDNYPSSSEMVSLLAQATDSYDQVVEIDELSCLACVGHFHELLLTLDRYEDSDWMIPVYNNDGILLSRMPVAEAHRAYTRLAPEWVINRTPHETEKARHALYELQDPEEAYQILEAFKLLVAGLMPDPEIDFIAKVIQNEIEPDRQRRREATRLLREAEVMPMSQIGQALEKMEAAIDIDPYAPGLEQIQKDFDERLRTCVRIRPEDRERWLIHHQLQEKEIEPARRRRKAIQLLRYAEITSQIVQAWYKMQAAKNVDPAVPDLERVQIELLKRLRSYVEWQLADSNRLYLDAEKELEKLEKESPELEKKKMLEREYRSRAHSWLREADASIQAALEAAALDDSLKDLQKQATELSLHIQAALRDQEELRASNRGKSAGV